MEMTGECISRHAPKNAPAMSRAGNTAHAISDARRGAGTDGEPVTDGTTRQTARRMKNCAMTHSTAATTNTASRTDAGNGIELIDVAATSEKGGSQTIVRER